MGVVYKARQDKANRIVALKMILSGKSVALAQKIRFQIEAGVVARLTHSYIVQLYEVGEQDGQPFFSLEFCPDARGRPSRSGLPWLRSADLV